MSNLFAFRKLMITWLSESSLFCGANVLISCSASSFCLLLNIFTHVEGHRAKYSEHGCFAELRLQRGARAAV